MDKIFVGFLFCYLNLNLNFGASTINLLPEFVGYILLYLGIRELAHESERYPKVQPFLIGLGVYTGIVWVMNLMGRTGSIVAVLLNLVAAVIDMYAVYQIIMGFEEIEHRHSVDIAAEKTLTCWKICVVIHILTIVLFWVPVLNILLMFGAIIAVIMLLVCVHKTRKLYNAYCLLQPGRDTDGPEF